MSFLQWHHRKESLKLLGFICLDTYFHVSLSNIFLSSTWIWTKLLYRSVRRLNTICLLWQRHAFFSYLFFSSTNALPSDCPKPPSIAAIIGGSVVAVAVIGFLLLLLIKLVIYVNDLKEYRKFEREREKSKWPEVRWFISVSFLCILSHSCERDIWGSSEIKNSQSKKSIEVLQNW